MKKTQYVLEWSHKTNSFHVQPLANLLAHNQQRFMDNAPLSDYATLMVGTHEACTEMADHWRDRLREREPFKLHAVI